MTSIVGLPFINRQRAREIVQQGGTMVPKVIGKNQVYYAVRTVYNVNIGLIREKVLRQVIKDCGGREMFDSVSLDPSQTHWQYWLRIGEEPLFFWRCTECNIEVKIFEEGTQTCPNGHEFHFDQGDLHAEVIFTG